jgi:hypothetical protein
MLRGSSHDSDSDDQMHHGLARQLGELLVTSWLARLGGLPVDASISTGRGCAASLPAGVDVKTGCTLKAMSYMCLSVS